MVKPQKKLGSRITINRYRNLFWCKFVLIILFFSRLWLILNSTKRNCLTKSGYKALVVGTKKYFHCLVSFFSWFCFRNKTLFTSNNPTSPKKLQRIWVPPLIDIYIDRVLLKHYLIKKPQLLVCSRHPAAPACTWR